MVFQRSWRSSQRCWALVCCFAFTLWSNSSQTISVRFGLSDCGGQVTKCKADGMACRCRMLWSPCWFSVHWILSHQQNIPTPPPSCFTVGTMHVETICSPFLLATETWWVEPKISNLDTSDQISDFHWPDVHSLCFLAQTPLFFFFFFLFFFSSGFFAATHTC